MEHDRTEPHDPAHSKAQAEKGNKPGADNRHATSAVLHTSGGTAGSQPAKNESGAVNTEEDEDDGQFDIDDLSSEPPAAVASEQEQKPVPLMYSPSGEALTFPERHQAAPAVRSPTQSSYTFDGPISPNEHDLSHSSAQHLRQYATYSRGESSSGNYSARDRTPRGGEGTRTPAGQVATSESTRPRSRSSIKRSHRVHNRHNTDRVKAFVVFGADSSDLDSSTSADESDDTAVRQAQQP